MGTSSCTTYLITEILLQIVPTFVTIFIRYSQTDAFVNYAKNFVNSDGRWRDIANIRASEVQGNLGYFVIANYLKNINGIKSGYLDVSIRNRWKLNFNFGSGLHKILHHFCTDLPMLVSNDPDVNRRPTMADQGCNRLKTA